MTQNSTKILFLDFFFEAVVAVVVVVVVVDIFVFVIVVVVASFYDESFE